MNLQDNIGIEMFSTDMENLSSHKAVKDKITALYFRLSDSKTEDESDSIENQREMLTIYAKEQGFINVEEFVDDGWTGIDFQNRPGFLNMMKAIESGTVETVIVKELKVK